MPTAKSHSTDAIRLQVFISHSGICSRRKAFDLIRAGKVMVNGQLTQEPSTPVVSGVDHVKVEGRLIQSTTNTYLMLHKPKGYVTTRSDQFAEKTIMELLPKKFQHLYPVGRLDKDTEGLLLLSNDGEFTNKLTHPKFHIEKIYYVRVIGVVTGQEKAQLQKGVIINGRKTAPARVTNLKVGKQISEFMISIYEGKKRQIRLMCNKIGHKVVYLKRVGQGTLKLGQLKKGSFRALTKKEISSV